MDRAPVLRRDTLTQRSVRLYFTDSGERAALEPVQEEFLTRGWEAELTDDFSAPSSVGVYAPGANRFFDFSTGLWSRPPSRFSVACLHDMYQDNGDGFRYFNSDSWHIFDLGLIPGPRWQVICATAEWMGIPGPRAGVRVGGWPKSDAALGATAAFVAQAGRLRSRLGLDARKPTVLLAASWQGRQHVVDFHRSLGGQGFNLIAKFPHFDAEVDPASPWLGVLRAQRAEAAAGRDLAGHLPGMILAPDDEDIFALLSLSDVVLSNGSNVLFEGLLLNKPGVVVTEWQHPAGERGELETSPQVEFPGLLNGPAEAIRALTRTALSAAFQPLVAMGASHLVRAEDRGVGAVRSVDAILQALQGPTVETEAASPAMGGTGTTVRQPSFLREEQERLRESLGRRSADLELNERDLGQELVLAVAQLHDYEQELRNRASALAAADEREAAARRQLESLKDELARLRGPD